MTGFMDLAPPISLQVLTSNFYHSCDRAFSHIVGAVSAQARSGKIFVGVKSASVALLALIQNWGKGKAEPKLERSGPPG